MKNKDKQLAKRKKTFARRKKWTTGLGIALASVALIFGAAWFTRDKNPEIETDSSDLTTQIAQSSSIMVTESDWNPNESLLISKVFVGNSKDIDDVSDDAVLLNLDYKAKAATAISSTMKGRKVKGEVLRINKHYFVVIFKGMLSGFNAIRVDITPVKLSKFASTNNLPSTLSFFVKEKKVKSNTRLVKDTKEKYLQDYRNYKVSWYKNKISKDETKISHSQKSIESNQKLIDQLTKENGNDAGSASSSSSNTGTIQSQVDELNSEIVISKQEISKKEKEISEYQKRIQQTIAGEND